MAILVLDDPEGRDKDVAGAVEGHRLEVVEVGFDDDAYVHRDRGLRGHPKELARWVLARSGGYAPQEGECASATIYAQNRREMDELLGIQFEHRCFGTIELVQPPRRGGLVSLLLRVLSPSSS